MRFRPVFFAFFMLLPFMALPASAETPPDEMQQAMSDTLDMWREGRYDQLFESLSHRGKTSKEQFVKKMRETSIRPACCWQKLEGFKVLSEKRTEAVVYAKIGLEGTPNPVESSTREFKLSNDHGAWRMQLGDITALAGAMVTKHKRGSRKKY